MKKYIVTETQMKRMIDRLVTEQRQITESKKKKTVKKEAPKQSQNKQSQKKQTPKKNKK